jgi:hypothetical protein
MKKLMLLNLILLLMSGIINAQTATPPLSGNGLSGNPYQIATLENLYWITANPTVWDKYFIQTANIDASATSGWATGWLPIGVYTEDLYNLFSGSYNGQGHTISGLHIADNSSYAAFGLFGGMNGATIQNLGIINIDINNVNGSAGAIAGYAEGVTINHCYSSGTISANNFGIYSFDAGGLVGFLFSNSTITDCYSSCDVSANNYAGGLVGYNYQSSVLNSYYVTGKVTGIGNYSYSGGLVGYNSYYASIYKCYSAGNVIGYDYTGGLVGLNTDYSSVSNCYSRSNCTFNAVYATYGGGLVGGNIAQSTILNCYSTGYVGNKGSGLSGYQIDASVLNSYWDTQSSEAEWSYQGTGKTTAEMKTLSTFSDAGWDFATIWGIHISKNDGYPYLLSISGCTNGTLTLSSETNIQTVCENAAITPIVYTVGGGASGATIAPTLPDGLFGTYDPVSRSFTISGTPTVVGAYSYTVTSSGTSSPCTEANATGTITVNESPTAEITGGNMNACGSTTLTAATDASNPTFAWYRNDNLIPEQVNSTLVVSKTGGYKVNVTSGINGCEKLSDAFLVLTVNPLPSNMQVSAEETEVCPGSTTNILISPSQTGIAYQLRNDDGDINIGARVNGNGSDLYISTGILNTTTTFNVMAFTKYCGLVMADKPIVGILSPPSITLGTVAPVCYGTLLASIPYSNLTNCDENSSLIFDWESPDLGDITILMMQFLSYDPVTGYPETGHLTVPLEVNQPSGTYIGTLYLQTGNCKSAGYPFTLTIKDFVEPPTVDGPGTVCQGVPFTLTANGASNATYSWNGSNRFSSSLQSPEITIGYYGENPSYYGYNVTQTVDGCTSEPTLKVIAVYNKPNAGQFLYNDKQVCEGTAYSVEYYIEPDPGGVWLSSNNAIATVVDGVISGISPGVATISYSVSGTEGCTGVADVESITITVTSLNAQITDSNSYLCGIGTAEFHLTGTPGAILSYLINGNIPPTDQVNFFNSDGYLTLSFPNVTDNQTLTLTGLQNGDNCSRSLAGSSTVTVNPKPTAPIIENVTQPDCNVVTGSVVLNGLPATGTWTLTRFPDGTTVTGTGASFTVSLLNAGTYTFSVSNASGCISTASSDVVIINFTALNVIASAGIITTYGGTTTLTANASGGTSPYQYSLNGGAFQPANTFTVSAGTYTVTARDFNSCTATSNLVTVTQPAQGNTVTYLIYSGERSVHYFDQASFSATLRDNRNRAIKDKTITFKLGSQTITAKTNRDGVASARLIITQVPGTYHILTTFAGDATYRSSNDDESFSISKKSVTAGLTGTVSKTYDGTAIAYLSPANYTLKGVVNNDAVSLNNPPTGTYNNKNVGTRKEVTVKGLALTGADEGKYSLSNTTVRANIGIIISDHKSAFIVTDAQKIEEEFELKVYPNPFSEKLHFEFVSPVDAQVRIVIYDITGRSVRTVFDSKVEKGVTYNTEFDPEAVISGMYIYRVILGESVYTGKAIYKK